MKFPEDHAIPVLQGYPYPKLSSVKRACAKRCVWLNQKIVQRAALGERTGLLIEELAGLAWLVEEAERVRSLPVVGVRGNDAWRRDAPPRDVCCLVTARDEAGVAWVTCATALPDHEDLIWLSAGTRVLGVIAWMPAPAPAEATPSDG